MFILIKICKTKNKLIIQKQINKINNTKTNKQIKSKKQAKQLKKNKKKYPPNQTTCTCIAGVNVT